MINLTAILVVLLLSYFVFQKIRFNSIASKMNAKYTNVIIIETYDTKDFWKTVLGYEKLGYTSVLNSKMYFVLNVSILVKYK